MPTLAPPDLDLARIRRFAAQGRPASVATQVRLDVEVAGANVTIVERRRPSTPDIDPTPAVDELIAELRADPDGVFWG